MKIAFVFIVVATLSNFAAADPVAQDAVVTGARNALVGEIAEIFVACHNQESTPDEKATSACAMARATAEVGWKRFVAEKALLTSAERARQEELYSLETTPNGLTTFIRRRLVVAEKRGLAICLGQQSWSDERATQDCKEVRAELKRAWDRFVIAKGQLSSSDREKQEELYSAEVGN